MVKSFSFIFLNPCVINCTLTIEGKRGTFVHPDFEKRGFGTWLTRHCSQIADDYSAATFVGVRPASLHMFQTLGFKLLGPLKLNMADYGQPSEAYATLRQDPQLKKEYIDLIVRDVWTARNRNSSPCSFSVQ